MLRSGDKAEEACADAYSEDFGPHLVRQDASEQYDHSHRPGASSFKINERSSSKRAFDTPRVSDHVVRRGGNQDMRMSTINEYRVPYIAKRQTPAHVRPRSTGCAIYAFEERPSNLVRKRNIADLRAPSYANARHARVDSAPVFPGSYRILEDALYVGADSARTSRYTSWEPAVVHQTITRNTHEFREERVTREIHYYHYHHRVLPVVDLEVLPERHFVSGEHGLEEISEHELSQQARPSKQWLYSEALSQSLAEADSDAPADTFIATPLIAKHDEEESRGHRNFAVELEGKAVPRVVLAPLGSPERSYSMRVEYDGASGKEPQAALLESDQAFCTRAAPELAIGAPAIPPRKMVFSSVREPW